MRGIQSQPLRKEFLYQKDPTLETLLRIANNWQWSSDVDKNMESSVSIKKATSSYKKGKQNNRKAKSASGPSPDDERVTPFPKPDTKVVKQCRGCGEDHPRKDCLAFKLMCHNCNKEGHIRALCRSAPNTERTSKVGKMTIEDEVICRRIASTTVIDNSDPIPMMENVKVEPIAENKKTKPTTMETFPDSGCQETLVLANLVDYLGLVLDAQRKKKIKGINGKTYVPCLGSTWFYVSQV